MELVIVIGIIGILASVVLVAINPTKQLGDARNAQRWSDVNSILNAVYQYTIDHNGTLPGNIPIGVPRPICQISLTGTACTGEPFNGVDLQTLTITGSYIADLPRDPLVTATGTGTHYVIVKTGANRITVTALAAENNISIYATR